MSEAASIRLPLCIAPAHPCLPGHFPGQPVVPGVVILDAVQAALEAAGHARAGWRLPQVKFLQPLLPGQAAQLEIDALAEGRFRFRVHRDDALIASGEVIVA